MHKEKQKSFFLSYSTGKKMSAAALAALQGTFGMSGVLKKLQQFILP